MVQRLIKKDRPSSLGGDNVRRSEGVRSDSVFKERYGPPVKKVVKLMIPIGSIIKWIKRRFRL